MEATDHARSAIYVAVGDKVRSIRTSRRMSQTALAAAVGLNRTSIVNIERGKQRILLHTLYEIAAALGVSPSDLLTMPAELSVAPDLELVHDPEARNFVKSVISSLKSPRQSK